MVYAIWIQPIPRRDLNILLLSISLNKWDLFVFFQRAMLGHEIEGENQLLELPTGSSNFVVTGLSKLRDSLH